MLEIRPGLPPAPGHVTPRFSRTKERSMSHSDQRGLSRRRFIGGAVVAGLGAAGAGVPSTHPADAAKKSIVDLVARPPAGFSPLVVPGRVVKVSAKGDFP